MPNKKTTKKKATKRKPTKKEKFLIYDSMNDDYNIVNSEKELIEEVQKATAYLTEGELEVFSMEVEIYRLGNAVQLDVIPAKVIVKDIK